MNIPHLTRRFRRSAKLRRVADVEAAQRASPDTSEPTREGRHDDGRAARSERSNPGPSIVLVRNGAALLERKADRAGAVLAVGAATLLQHSIRERTVEHAVPGARTTSKAVARNFVERLALRIVEAVASETLLLIGAAVVADDFEHDVTARVEIVVAPPGNEKLALAVTGTADSVAVRDGDDERNKGKNGRSFYRKKEKICDEGDDGKKGENNFHCSCIFFFFFFA